MSENKLGIETLKPAVLSVVRILNAGEKAIEDGIQPFGDVLAILPSLMALPGIAENRAKIVAEALEVNSAEAEELSKAVEEELGFGSAKARAVTSRALVALVAIVNVIVELRTVASTPS